MNSINHNLQYVHHKIRKIAQASGYDSQHIAVLAVSKNQPITAIEAAIHAGQLAFGENYVQEGIEKIRWFRKHQLGVVLSWHFIGSLQSNKSRLVAEYFDWCHTIDSQRLVHLLNKHRPELLAPLNILIQINICGEKRKSGITPDPDQLLELAEMVETCPRLRLRGLMSIAAPNINFDRQLMIFRRIAALFEHLASIYTSADTLSLGMSNDMQAAIAAGSTMVRIGTAIFGPRNIN